MYRQSIQFPAKDAALREDVHALGDLIGETLRDQGGEEFCSIGGGRSARGDSPARRRRRGCIGTASERTDGPIAVRGHRPDARILHLVSGGEHGREGASGAPPPQYLSDSSTSQPGGIADCIARLQRDGVTLQQALSLIGSMSIEPVFTAHPTESTRRTILRKQQHIAQDLLERTNPGSTPHGIGDLVGARAARGHQHLADRGASARRSDGGR